MIHAYGLGEKNDHDPVGGVLYKKLQLVNAKLIEPATDKKLQGMPPVRMGTWTEGKMAELWTIEDKKKN